LGDRQEGTYRLHGQYKPDAQASACVFCVAMECTRLRVGLVLVCVHLPITIKGLRPKFQSSVKPEHSKSENSKAPSSRSTPNLVHSRRTLAMPGLHVMELVIQPALSQQFLM